ncbi:hypothetical protein BC827DRAFT_1155320 [Russula dissimulans]|nr:hypothetical protein BC827DRAFT_1155320 [Russula dissimulans]
MDSDWSDSGAGAIRRAGSQVRGPILLEADDEKTDGAGRIAHAPVAGQRRRHRYVRPAQIIIATWPHVGVGPQALGLPHGQFLTRYPVMILDKSADGLDAVSPGLRWECLRSGFPLKTPSEATLCWLGDYKVVMTKPIWQESFSRFSLDFEPQI